MVAWLSTSMLERPQLLTHGMKAYLMGIGLTLTPTILLSMSSSNQELVICSSLGTDDCHPGLAPPLDAQMAI